jgi:hypothetical protein
LHSFVRYRTVTVGWRTVAACVQQTGALSSPTYAHGVVQCLLHLATDAPVDNTAVIDAVNLATDAPVDDTDGGGDSGRDSVNDGGGVGGGDAFNHALGSSAGNDGDDDDAIMCDSVKGEGRGARIVLCCAEPLSLLLSLLPTAPVAVQYSTLRRLVAYARFDRNTVTNGGGGPTGDGGDGGGGGGRSVDGDGGDGVCRNKEVLATAGIVRALCSGDFALFWRRNNEWRTVVRGLLEDVAAYRASSDDLRLVNGFATPFFRFVTPYFRFSTPLFRFMTSFFFVCDVMLSFTTLRRIRASCMTMTMTCMKMTTIFAHLLSAGCC